MRPFRFVIHLREFGWEPTVVTIDVEGQHLTEKEERLLREVDIVRLKPLYDRSVNAESQLGLARSAAAVKGNHDSLFGKALNGLDRLFPVDAWLLLFWMKYRVLVDTIHRVKPDVLWSTGDPWSGLVIGEKLSRRFDIPWVADFRDPWTLCEVRTDGKPEWTHMMDQRHERRILETADRVLFQARQTEANYRAHYPIIRKKTSTIYNSYDPDVFDDPVRLDAARPHTVSEGKDLHIGFFGRFRAMSPANLIVDVLTEAHRRHGAAAGRIKIHPFGPLNADDERLSKERGVFEQFEPAPAVPLEKSLDVLGRFDILLVSTDQRRDEIIPAKLLEYLAAARPILSMSANPEVGAILEKTGAGIQPGPDAIEAVADLLVECVASKDEGVPLPIPFRLNADEVTRFDARTTTQELAALFDDVLTARLRPVSA